MSFLQAISSGLKATVDANNTVISHTNSDGDVYTVYAFTQSGSLNVITGGEAHVLIVGGGGSGDLSTNPDNGGGGAGGLIFKPNHQINSGSYPVTVGAGGVGDAADGANSVFDGLTALGGGRGDDGSNDAVGNGGSGGGGGSAGLQPSQSGDSGTFGYGNAGGDTSGDSRFGAGGGGAGTAGTAGSTVNSMNKFGGNGGDGLYEVTQSGTTYNFMKIFGGYGEVIDGESWFAGGGAGTGDNSTGDGGEFSQVMGTGGKGGGGGYHNHHYALQGGYASHEQGDMDVINGLPNTGGGGPGNDFDFIATSGDFTHRGGSGIVLIAVKGKQNSVQDGSTPEKAAPSAKYILDNVNASAPSGLYWIRPSNSTFPPSQVYCDMTTDGGGWMHMATFTDRAANATGSGITNYDLHPWGFGLGHFKNGRINKRNWQNGYWGDMRPLGTQSFTSDFKHTPGWFSIPFSQILMKDSGDSLRNLWYTNPGQIPNTGIDPLERAFGLGNVTNLSLHKLDNNLNDSTGSYTASNNGASFTTTRRHGSHAINTMGDGTYIDIPGLPRIYAVSLWYYCVGNDNGYIVDFRHDDPNNLRSYLYTLAGSDQYINLNDDTTTSNGTGDIWINGVQFTSGQFNFASGNWYHIVISWNDNVSQAWDQGIRIGNRSDGTSAGNAGYFDQIRTFNRALTASDVAYLYQAETQTYTNNLQDFFNTGGKDGVKANTHTWEDGGTTRSDTTRSLVTSIAKVNSDDVFGSATNIIWAYGEAIDENPTNHDRSMITTYGINSESVSATQGIGVSRADEVSNNYRNIDPTYRDEPGSISSDYNYTMWIR